ncbi:MAG: carboxypeptidase-like regulatory domain-containing protein, partial [Chitinophagaceae bacterium]|nr:carboxypeptidase-like regulatory domain-containing protein [Chitinophagaceae bacterium]
MKQILILVLAFMLPGHLFAQNNTQNIRGVVLDKQSQSVIIGATVSISGSNLNKGAQTNEKGQYMIGDVAPGRYEIKISYVGYKEVVIPNVVVSSGKETIVDVAMEENVRSLKGAVVKGFNKA